MIINLSNAAKGRPGPRDRRRGVITILLALSSVLIIGLAGVATDLARMYIVKNELQNYTDSAALAAVGRMDGTMDGINRARSEAIGNSNDWLFETRTVDIVTAEFAQTLEGPWLEAPAEATGYRYVRVSADANVPMYLVQIFEGVGKTKPVRARSTAGLVFQSAMSDGIFPFSPDAHDPNDPNFGYLLGKEYTLRYDKVAGNPTNGPSPTTYLLTMNNKKLIGCPADMESAPAFRPGFTVGSGNSAERGYIDLSDRMPTNPGGGANLISDGVLGRTSYGLAVEIGYPLVMEPGNKASIENALIERVEQDTDGNPSMPRQTPTYYTRQQTTPFFPTAEEMNNIYRSQYDTDFPRPPNGNGRRIVTVPANDPANNMVVGFAAFFLPLDPCEDQGPYNGRMYNPCCGEYVGAVTLNGGAAPGPGAGLFRAFLLE